VTTWHMANTAADFPPQFPLYEPPNYTTFADAICSDGSASSAI
jgi:hypothetical protein